MRRQVLFGLFAIAAALAGVALVLATLLSIPVLRGMLSPRADASQDPMDTRAALLTEFDADTFLTAPFDTSTSTRIHASILEYAPQLNRPGKTVVVDLESMHIFAYMDGVPMAQYDVLSIGRPGSAWETPPGEYEVKYMTPKHLSSIGGVYMPYSMQFFGNYFIHGWPYYPDGSEVSEGYSGGCIRLADEDAKAVYEFAEVGTPVLVFGESANIEEVATSTGYYSTLKGSRVPRVTASSFLVADLETGDVILEKRKDEPMPIASLTKLMTALTSLEVVNQFNDTTVSARAAATYGSQGEIKAGQTMMVRDLLYPLLLESSNDAAEAIAEVVNRDYFLKSMNDKAKAIGLASTSYEDASGLSPKNISTSADLFELTRYIYKYKSYILDVTTRKNQEVGDRVWDNISRFKNDEGYIGGKNGYTDEAMHTLVAAFDMPLAEFEDRPVAVVLLGSLNKEEDARALLDYVERYVYYTHDTEKVAVEN